MLGLGAAIPLAACTTPSGSPGPTVAQKAPQASAAPVIVPPAPSGPMPPPSPPEPVPLPFTAPQSPGAAPVTPIRVGILVPLTGQGADVGQALLDAAEIALFDFGDPRLNLIPADTGQGAAQAAQKVLDNGAEIILGPLFSADVSAVAPLARARNVPVVAFSTDKTVAGDGVFLMGFLPEDETVRVATFALAQGLKRFAALVPEGAYGQLVTRSFETAVKAGGGKLVKVETYPRNPAGLYAPAQRLAQAAGDPLNPVLDAVLVAEGPPLLMNLAPLIPYYQIDVKKVRLLGTGQWDDPRAAREPALQGGWFPAPSPEGRAAFLQKYQDLHGRAPPRIASLGYDAVALAAVLARNGGAKAFTREALTVAQGFAGIDGILRWRDDGLPERGLAVQEITPAGFTTIDPAPTQFTTAPGPKPGT